MHTIIHKLKSFPEILHILLTIALINVAIFLIAPKESVIQEFSIDIFASIAMVFITLFLIDSYYERKKSEELRGVKSLVYNEVNQIVGRIISAYVLFYDESRPNLNNPENFKSNQTEAFLHGVTSKLNSDYFPQNINYEFMYKNMSDIPSEILLILSVHSSHLHPKIIEALITLKEFLVMLNLELASVNHSKTSEMTSTQAKNIQAHLSFVKSSVELLSTVLVLFSEEKSENFYNLSRTG